MGDVMGKRLSRRDFVKLATLGTAGAYFAVKTGMAEAAGGMGGGGMGGGGCGGGCGGGTTIIDPPPGALLRDPELWVRDSIAPDGAMVGRLEARQASVSVGGKTANLLTYDGKYPGRLIRLKKGDKLRLTLTNNLPEGPANLLGHLRGETSLHTHGWHVSPMTEDNVMKMLMPGESWEYNYDLVNQDAGTLCWYHPHTHILTAEQVWGGLHGLLIVEDDVAALSGLEEHVLVLKDITISNGYPAPYTSLMEFMHGKEGDTVMVNGQVNPVLNIRPGQVQRWRLLNASNARFYKLQLAGHQLQVVGTDGGLLDKPYPQSYAIMSPGERLDVLVKASTTKGTYKLSSMPYSRMGMMTAAQITMLTLNVTGTAVSQSVPSVIKPAKRMNLDLSMLPKKTFTLSMGQGRGYINGQDFDVNPCTVESMMDMEKPVYEVWTLQNMSNMDHPWHQHINPAQVLSISGGDSAYRTLYTTTPAWKDVVIVPKMGSVTQLVRISDYMGMAMFHCHILEHEDIGMMGIWNIGMEMPMPM